jgi:hypothetical protein
MSQQLQQMDAGSQVVPAFLASLVASQLDSNWCWRQLVA